MLSCGAAPTMLEVPLRVALVGARPPPNDRTAARYCLWDATIVAAFMNASQDPDRELLRWLRRVKGWSSPAL